MVYIALATLVAAICMLSPGLAFAADWGRGHGRYHGSEVDITKIAGLKLTAPQLAQIRAIHENYLKDIEPLQDAIQSKGEELRYLWMQDRPDREKIASAQKEVMALRDRLRDKHLDYRDAIAGVLDAEQQRRLQDVLPPPEMRPDARGMMERRRGGQERPPAMQSVPGFETMLAPGN